MDLLDADETKLIATVRQFRTINRLVSRSRSLIRTYILRPARSRGLSRITVLDVGAGGCDIGQWIVRAAEGMGISARVICLDQDPRIIAYARQCTAGNPDIEVVQGSAEEIERWGPVDYIFANHFLHHLPDAAIVALLPRIARTARYGYVLNDLRRSRLSHLAYSLLAGLFFRGSFAYADGRLSIQRGFTAAELQLLVASAQRGAEQRAATQQAPAQQEAATRQEVTRQAPAQREAEQRATTRQEAVARVVSLVPGRLAVVAHVPDRETQSV